MMRISIFDFLSFYKFPAGRQLTALRKMLGLLEGVEGVEALRLALQGAVKALEALFQLELRWRYRKQHRVEHGERAGELDKQLDRYLKGVGEILDSQQRFADLTPELARAAEDMSQALFPYGATTLTQMSYSDQCHAVFHMLEVYDDSPAFQNLAAELGVAGRLDAIRELNFEYSREVAAAEPPSRQELLEARREAELRLGEILARIFGLYPTESDEDRKARARLLAPLEHQNEALRVLNKRHANRKLRDDDGVESADADLDDSVLDIDPDAAEPSDAAPELNDTGPQAEAA